MNGNVRINWRVFCAEKSCLNDWRVSIANEKMRSGIKIWGESIALYGILAIALFKTPLAVFLFLPSVLMHAKRKRKKLEQMNERLMLQEFVDFLDFFNVSVMAGVSMENSIGTYIKSVKSNQYGPKGDFITYLESAAIKIETGAGMRVFLDEICKLFVLNEIHFFAMCLKVGITMGGDIKKLVYESSRQIKQKIMMEQDIEALISEKKLEVAIMGIMPYGVLYMMKTNMADISEPLFTSPLGIGAMFFLFLMFEGARLIGDRIADIRI